ncbi:MAG: hypothetical protein IT364_01890, partial [Candidatus Hydrogenedentes bacterium]|nr:hypothetical protein [Candidatus Hydrogenedentota bacterium]
MSIRIESGPQKTGQNDSELIVLLGIPEHHKAIADWFDAGRVKPLTELNPGLEGFLLHF